MAGRRQTRCSFHDGVTLESGSPADPPRIPLLYALTPGGSSGDPQGINDESPLLINAHSLHLEFMLPYLGRLRPPYVHSFFSTNLHQGVSLSLPNSKGSTCTHSRGSERASLEGILQPSFPINHLPRAGRRKFSLSLLENCRPPTQSGWMWGRRRKKRMVARAFDRSITVV